MIYIVNKSQNFFIKHSWSNGRIIAFQAIGPGSTPGGCTPSFSSIAVVAEYVHDFFGGLEDGEGGWMSHGRNFSILLLYIFQLQHRRVFLFATSSLDVAHP
jgi:hypothetical protein